MLYRENKTIIGCYIISSSYGIQIKLGQEKSLLVKTKE